MCGERIAIKDKANKNLPTVFQRMVERSMVMCAQITPQPNQGTGVAGAVCIGKRDDHVLALCRQLHAKALNSCGFLV